MTDKLTAAQIEAQAKAMRESLLGQEPASRTETANFIAVLERTALDALAEVERLKTALKPFSDALDDFDPDWPATANNLSMFADVTSLTKGDFIRALAAKLEAVTAERDNYHNLYEETLQWVTRTREQFDRAEAAELERKKAWKVAYDATTRGMAAEAALQAERERGREAAEIIDQLHYAMCSDTGFAAAVRADTGRPYPWPAGDIAAKRARAFLARIGKGEA